MQLPGHARVVPGLSEASFLTSEDFEVLWALAAIATWQILHFWCVILVFWLMGDDGCFCWGLILAGQRTLEIFWKFLVKW